MGLLCRLRQGVYVRTEHWRTLKPWDKEKLRLRAHVVSARGKHTYSHYSAARFHGLSVWNCGDRVHLTSKPNPTGSGVAKDVIFHHLALAAGERRVFTIDNAFSIVVTSLERTVVDCARSGKFEQAVIIGDSALHKGAKMEIMNAMVGALAGKPGARKARRVLTALNGASESAGETRTRLFMAGMDIPQPVLQHRIITALAEFRADFAWPDLKLILEFDGEVKYYAFAPTTQVLREERRRENLLIEEGWRVIRVEWSHLDTPAELRRSIFSAVQAARRAVRRSAHA